MNIPREALRSVAVVFAMASMLAPPHGSGQSAASTVLFSSPQYIVARDRVTEGTYSAVAVSSDEIDSNYPSHPEQSIPSKWVLHANLSSYPQLHSDSVLIDAVYKMSLEELTEDISKEGTFDAGALWPGPWTRDVSYSVFLSLAAVDPAQAEATLLRKVKRGRIVQDTGTGGSWPVSSDREVWAIAAWQIYVVTGDRTWLKKSAAIIKRSIADDEQVVIDPHSGLAHGETSFMDWREQTYPRWMQPADIYSSEALSTNAIFYRVYRILAAMDREMGRDAQEWDRKADRIQSSVNKLFWRKDAGLYGEYRYGRISLSLCPRTDALGESLSVLFDLASPAQQQSILRQQPLMPYGVPTVFPETPDIPPYHNRAVWPFVQAFYNLAAAKDGDQALLSYGLGSIYRAAALCLSNKENFVADTGSPIGTVVNSDRQLWSVAGSLAMIYRVFFGMKFASGGLSFAPVIPESFGGTYELSNFHYRGAILTIRVSGFGDEVRAIRMDGISVRGPISSALTGKHSIEIELKPRSCSFIAAKTSGVPTDQSTALDTPSPAVTGGTLAWPPIKGSLEYGVYVNGMRKLATKESSVPVLKIDAGDELQVDAIASSGVQSFLSAPIHRGPAALTFSVSSMHHGHGDSSFVTLDQTGRSGLRIFANVPSAGTYSISFRYANGSGPLNTGSECAIRTLFVDSKKVGPIILPQRGTDEWNNWGESSRQYLWLSAGAHTFDLRFLPADRNMNGKVNRAEIASVDIVPVERRPSKQ